MHWADLKSSVPFILSFRPLWEAALQEFPCLRSGEINILRQIWPNNLKYRRETWSIWYWLLLKWLLCLTMNLIYRTLVRRTPRPGKMLTPRPPPWLRSIRWSITFIFFAALFFNGCYSEIWPWREHLWLCGTRAGSVQVGNCYSSWWSSDHWSSWLLGMMITWKSPVERHWKESSCTVIPWLDTVH